MHKKNGLFLQKKTVLQIKQDLIDYPYNKLCLVRNQANYLLFFKKIGNAQLNVQKRNVTRTMSETAVYGVVWDFMKVASFLNGKKSAHSLRVYSHDNSTKKRGR